MKKRMIPIRAPVLVYALITFVVQEIIFRVCFPVPEIANFNRINYQFLDSAARPGYMRNIRMIWKSYPDTLNDFVCDLNAYGFRDKSWKINKPKTKKRIMFIGDSFIEGMMTDERHTIPASFAASADNGNVPVETMNFGMLGIGLNEYLQLIVDAVPVFKPDHVFLVLFSNDVSFKKPRFPSAQFRPKYMNTFKPRIFELICQWWEKRPIPFRWKLRGKPYSPPVPNPANPMTFYGNEIKQHVTPEIAEAMKKGDFNFFHPNDIILEELFLKAYTDIKPQLSSLKSFIEHNGAKMYVFYIPSRSQVTTYYYQFKKQYCLQLCPDLMDLTQEQYQIHGKMLRTRCEELSIPLYDFTAEIKGEEQNGNHLYWNYDNHMRSKGYENIGKKMFEWWSKN